MCENPAVDVIGHPTTAMFPFDYEPMLKTVKETGKLVEINESSLQWKPAALENAYPFYAMCKKYEIPLVLSTDAHYSGLVGVTPLAAKVLGEIDFPKRLLYSLEPERLMAMAEAKRGISFG